MPRPVPVLVGELVTLREIEPDRDAGEYYEWSHDPAMREWTGDEPPASPAEALAELERFADMEDFTMWAVAESSSGQMIGRFFACLEDREGRLVAGEGNRIAKEFWRGGHTREVYRLVHGYLFDCLQADCIESECWTEDADSRESLTSRGFTLVREETVHSDKHGREMSKSCFQLTRQQWLAAM